MESVGGLLLAAVVIVAILVLLAALSLNSTLKKILEELRKKK